MMQSKQQIKLLSKWLGTAVMGFALLGIPVLTIQTQAAGFDRSERHFDDDDDDDRRDSKRNKKSRARDRRDWDDDDDDDRRRRFSRSRRNRNQLPWWFNRSGNNRNRGWDRYPFNPHRR